MKNPLVHLERLAHDKLVVKKSRGELTVQEIFEAFRGVEGVYALFIRAPEFDGYLGEGRLTHVMLYSATEYDDCPVCGKARDAMYNEMYEEAVREGYREGVRDARNDTVKNL
jgi:hypothetical protein